MITHPNDFSYNHNLFNFSMSDNCQNSCCHGGTPFDQNLDELEFERGIWQAAFYGDTDKIKSFITKGTDINIKDSSGYTATHYAARNNHIDSVKYLLSEGACVNCTTKCGKDTPLHRAAFVGNLEIVRLLLQHNADYKLQNTDGQTSLHKAVQGGHEDIIKLLLTYDDLVHLCDNKGKAACEYAKDEEVSNLLKAL